MNTSNVPLWVQIGSTLTTPLVAVFVAFVAWRQWKTAREKLVLDLFDRRFRLFEEARQAISPIIGAGKPSEENIRAFYRIQNEAQFLFGRDVNDYLSEVEAAIFQSGMAHAEMENLPRGEERSALVKKSSAAFDIISEFPRRFPALISPYMRMDTRVPGSLTGWLQKFRRNQKS